MVAVATTTTASELFPVALIGGSGKQAHSLAGVSRKKYWVSGSSEAGYRRIFFAPI